MAKLIHLLVNIFSGTGLRVLTFMIVYSVNPVYAWSLLALYIINHVSDYLYSVEMVKEYKTLNEQLKKQLNDEV